MFCSECGKEIPDGSAFCKYCGTKLVADAGAPEETPEAAAAAVSETAEASEAASDDKEEPTAAAVGAVATAAASTAQVATTSAAAGATPTPHLTTPARKKNKGPLIIGVVAALAVAAVAAVVYAVFLSPYNIDANTFPDEGLRKVLSRTYDSDHDGKLSREEAGKITKLDFSESADIENLKGIELLPNLKTLNLSGCAYVESLDVSKNGNLESLAIDGTSIDSLDLSHNRAIKTVDASGSSLSSINISGCENLRALNLQSTNVLSVDLSGAKSLEEFAIAESAEVSGLESTNLREQWVITSASVHGAHEVAYPVMGSVGDNSSRNYTFTYNGKNQLTFVNCVSRSASNSTSSVHAVTYNYEGDRVSSIDDTRSYLYSTGYSSISTEKLSYYYTDKGQLSSYSVKYDSGRSTNYSYSYDENGRQTGFSDYSFTYDDEGRLATVLATYMSRPYLSISYNDANMIERIVVGGNSSYSFEYDDSGRCIVKHYAADPNARAGGSYDVKCTYDDLGRLSQMQTLSTSGEVAGTATFEYDERGNMVKETISNPKFSSSTGYDQGVWSFSYGRVFTKASDPDIQQPLMNLGTTNHEYIAIPMDQKFAGEVVFEQTGLVFSGIGGPYIN